MEHIGAVLARVLEGWEMSCEVDHDLIEAAKRYMAVIDQLERTASPAKLRQLEHQRVDLHWDFMDLLRQRGIQFRDRNHATEIAKQIARKS